MKPKDNKELRELEELLEDGERFYRENEWSMK
jgi:hypothetical protein